MLWFRGNMSTALWLMQPKRPPAWRVFPVLDGIYNALVVIVVCGTWNRSELASVSVATSSSSSSSSSQAGILFDHVSIHSFLSMFLAVKEWLIDVHGALISCRSRPSSIHSLLLLRARARLVTRSRRVEECLIREACCPWPIFDA